MDPLALKTALQQGLRLSPQLLQSMQILQMDSQELLEYINTLSEENPAFEKEDSPALQKEFHELQQKVSWLDTSAGFHHAPQEDGDDSPSQEAGAWDRETESLSAFLCDQLERRKLPPPILTLCKYLAELLDADGYLGPEDLESVEKLGIPDELIQESVRTLQTLEPAGVAARDLKDCLLLQLDRLDTPSTLARSIVAEHLEALGKKQYRSIAKILQVSEEEVREAERLIQSLEPRPGAAFDLEAPTEYIRPDVFIVELEGQLQPVLNTFYLPRVYVSDYYVRMMNETPEAETRDYLRQKVRQAKWVMDCLERRRSTLEGCASAILEVQRSFFSGKTPRLAPMTLQTVAAQLNVHESTVSRCVRGKYLQCRQGTFPLRYFFTRSVAGGSAGVSGQAVRLELARLIREENPDRPLSDQGLCELLAGQGMPIARRTVAKYREQLHLPAASGRKRRKETPPKFKKAR